MFLKLFSLAKNYRQSLALAFLTSISYILGYGRDKIFSYFYGPTEILDIYNASFIIPDTIMNFFLTGALVSVLVPFLNKHENDPQKQNILTAILQGGLVINIIICSIAFFIMPYIVPYVIHDAASVADVTFYSRILLLSPLLFLISRFLGGILIKERNLFAYGISPILYNLGIIAGVVFLRDWNITGIIIGNLVGALLGILFQYFSVRKNYPALEFRYTAKPDWKYIKNSLKYFVFLTLPKMASLTLYHINVNWLFTYFASQNGTGSIFMLNLCKNFYNVPISVISIALATDGLSVLSKHVSLQQFQRVKYLFQKYLFLIAGSALLASLFFYFFSYPIIDFFFGGGKFDQAAVLQTSFLLSFFGIVIFFESIMQYFARVLHALQDTFWQMISQALCFIITTSYLVTHFPSMKMMAIPVSLGIGMLAQNILQGIIIYKKLWWHKDRNSEKKESLEA